MGGGKVVEGSRLAAQVTIRPRVKQNDKGCVESTAAHACATQQAALHESLVWPRQQARWALGSG